MFTRFSKVFLWIMVVGVVVVAICAAAAAEEAIVFFPVFLAGCVVLMFFGMFVEMCNNILDIKKILSKGGVVTKENTNEVQSSQNFMRVDSGKWYCRKCGTENSGDETHCAGCGASVDNKVGASNMGYNLSQLAQQTDKEKQNEAGWFCRHCGTKNKKLMTYCSGCGKER